ncbi:hypothetical protein NY08_1587 [Rhodococcus sp. B7740]|nr:hypothetical protein NY08_1587 [Rhodococcus sp. B7740]
MKTSLKMKLARIAESEPFDSFGRDVCAVLSRRRRQRPTP